MVILMLGAQGTGKGTVAGILSKKTGWPQISTGDIFRKNISEKTELGIEANKYITAEEIKEKSRVSIATAKRRLKTLQEKGIIVRQNGKRDGLGIYIKKNVARFIGYFIQDSVNGFGKLTDSNGDEYIGYWKNSEANGLGIYTRKKIISYRGWWKNDYSV